MMGGRREDAGRPGGLTRRGGRRTRRLAPGRRARESNDVIRDRGWEPIDLPQAAALRPARF